MLLFDGIDDTLALVSFGIITKVENNNTVLKHGT